MALRNLFVQLAIGVTGQSQVEGADKAMRKFLRTTELVGGALKAAAVSFTAGAFVGSLASFIDKNLQAADALFNQAQKLGMTTDELQKYQYAAAQLGVTQNEVAVAFRFFNRAVGEAQLGTKAAVKTFAQLGILKDVQDPLATTNDLILKFADRLEKLPTQAERTAFVMRTLGRGGSALLPILQQGSKRLREVFQDVEELGGGFDQRFSQAAHNTEIQLKKLRFGWRTIATAILREFLPSLDKSIKRSLDFAKYLIYLSKVTYGFRTALIFLAGTVTALAIAFGAWLTATYVWLAPVIAAVGVFVGLMTALYVAFDDFYTFLQGGESVLGNFLEELGGTGAAKKFRDDLVAAFEDVKKAFGFLTDAADGTHKSLLQIFIGTIPDIIKWGGIFTSHVLALVERAEAAVERFRVSWGYLFGDVSGAAASAAIDKINADLDEHLASLTKLRDQFGKIGAVGAPVVNQGYGSTPNNFVGPLPLRPGTDPNNFLALPPPPPPGGTAPVTVHVTNNIHGGTNGEAPTVSTKVKVNGDTKNRNTHSAIRQGMPSTGD